MKRCIASWWASNTDHGRLTSDSTCTKTAMFNRYVLSCAYLNAIRIPEAVVLQNTQGNDALNGDYYRILQDL